MTRRRIWSETVPLDTLSAPATLQFVRRHGLELLAAVRPGELACASRLVRAAHDEGVRLALWPMIDDREGRWASAHNVSEFDRFVRAMLDALERDGALPDELAIDLEPPFGVVSRVFSGLRDPRRESARRWLPGGSLRDAHAQFHALIEDLHARGVAVSAAAMPMVLLDAPESSRGGWQRLLGTPVDHLPWDHVSAMLYTSIFEGWSLGVVRRDDARSVLATLCRRAAERYGATAGVSLGAVSTGAFGDEPVFRSPDELADDVAIAHACGLDALTLFDLGGVLRRPPAEAWLEAFTAPPRTLSGLPHTARGALVTRLGAGVGRIPW